MLYLTELYAVNLAEPNDTTNTDWHGAHHNWDNAPLAESDNSIFKDFQIEKHSFIISGKNTPGTQHHI